MMIAARLSAPRRHAGHRLTWMATVLLGGVMWVVSVHADDATLSKDCEDGFRRLIHMAQTGGLGSDVINANVGIANNQVHVELVRAEAPNKVLLLTPKRTPQAIARYFNVSVVDGASPSDVERLGRALDEIFTDDPFQLVAFEHAPGEAPIASLRQAWAYGQWRGLAGVLERRMMVLATLDYTVAVIALLAAGLLACLAVLWGSERR